MNKKILFLGVDAAMPDLIKKITAEGAVLYEILDRI